MRFVSKNSKKVLTVLNYLETVTCCTGSLNYGSHRISFTTLPGAPSNARPKPSCPNSLSSRMLL